MSPRPATRPSREERRAQLLEAAVTAIRTHGPGVSMEQLAAAGGVTKPILYRHFGDRDGLIAAIGEDFAAALLDRIATELHGGTEPRDLLRATIGGYLAFLDGDPQVYAFLQSHVPRTAGSDEQIGGLIEAVGRQVAVVIGDQLRAAGLDAGGAEPYAFGIVGMVHQAGDWWLRTRTMSREALLDYLCDLLWGGFAGLGPGPGSSP